jgi:hypothetical protein
MPAADKCESMKPIKKPFLPESDVSLMVVSGNMPAMMRKRLSERVPRVISLPPNQGLHGSLMNHPDLMVACPAEGVLVHSPDMDPAIIEMVRDYGFTLIPGEKRPFGNYPADVPYNVAVIGRNAFLNTRFTDRVVLECLVKAGVAVNHVSQGYAKCSVCMLNEEAMITSDEGIFRAARAKNIDVLLIPPQKSIELEGFGYGFIGGATGLISKDELAISGEFDRLDDAGTIARFLDKYGIRPVSLDAGRVLDLGSLIPLCTV